MWNGPCTTPKSGTTIWKPRIAPAKNVLLSTASDSASRNSPDPRIAADFSPAPPQQLAPLPCGFLVRHIHGPRIEADRIAPQSRHRAEHARPRRVDLQQKIPPSLCTHAVSPIMAPSPP